MLKHYILSSLVAIPLVAQAPQDLSLKVDVSSMECIFAIMDILDRNEEPSETQWKDLLATPGYAAMLKYENNRGPLFYIDCIRIACKPSLNAEYETAIHSPKDEWGKVMAASLPHFRKAKDERKHLEMLVAQLKDAKLNSRILSLVNDYLPIGSPRKNVTVSFILFGPDARGGYGPIIMDALFYQHLGTKRERTLAHELHHAWRSQWEDSILSNEDDVVWTLKQVMLEGIADRINIAPSLISSATKAQFAETENGRDYLKHLDRCTEIIQAMDTLLLKMAKEPSQREILGQEFRTLAPRSGHLPGYYMATVIETQLGKDRLIKDQINPANFFLLYDEAAAKDGKAPRFSEGSKAYLRYLGRHFELFKL